MKHFYDRGTYYNVPYWTAENAGNKWARVDSYETNFNVWEKNSFIRLDNVSLSYSIPTSLLSRIKSSPVAGCLLWLIIRWYMLPNGHGWIRKMMHIRPPISHLK